MIFYTAFFKFEETSEQEEQPKTRSEERRQYRDMAARTERFNREELKTRGKVFLSEIDEDGFTVGLIAKQARDAERILKKYGAALFPSAHCDKTEEVTFRQICECLCDADRNDCIEDDDKVLQEFGLNGLARFSCYGEALLEHTTRRELEQTAGSCFARKTLVPELQRIFAGRALKNGQGHPVHYMLITDNDEVRRVIHRTLLGALYRSGRIENKRFCFVNMNEELVDDGRLGALYKSCAGGAVLVRFSPDDEEESDTVSAKRAMAEQVCRLMKEYRNEVLTVLCLPHKEKGLRNAVYEELPGMTLVEIADELIGGSEARDYLTSLAKKERLRPDRALYDAVKENEEYYATDLKQSFERWQAEKLKNAVYPQYRDLTTVQQRVKTESRGVALEELNTLIGLDNAKTVISQALDYYKAQKLFAQRGFDRKSPSMHMLFTGNPGTAKTTVARLFARIMRENGVLPVGHMVEVGRGDLVGKYIGWTAPIIKQKFKRAKGGVLFIDEAYSLVDDRDGSFGDEAINTIVQEMENNREDVAVIFAGYPDKMKKFLDKNPGLRSRIAFHVPFDDYTAEELCAIADLQAKELGNVLEPAARQKLTVLFEAARRDADFGNGRYVRNVLERARMAQASRLMREDPDRVSAEALKTLTADDILPPPVLTVRRPAIGFGA